MKRLGSAIIFNRSSTCKWSVGSPACLATCAINGFIDIQNNLSCAADYNGLLVPIGILCGVVKMDYDG